MNGILPLWKPRGMTSHDCVAKARRLLHTKKIGHTGTLDPEVEGVLPLCIGRATKIVPYLTETKKTYEAEVTLGQSTETEDSYGQVVEEVTIDSIPSRDQLLESLRTFTGHIEQVPPMYSAVKVKGRKLYEYARAGETVERPVRQASIYAIDLLSDPVRKSDGQITFSFRVICSKGTYIRTLCVAIGQDIGFPAHMSDLVRTQTGNIAKEDCYHFDQLAEMIDNQSPSQFLLPLMRGIGHLDTWEVDAATKEMVAHGRVLSAPDRPFRTEEFVICYRQEAVAIYMPHPEKAGKIKPVRVF